MHFMLTRSSFQAALTNFSNQIPKNLYVNFNNYIAFKVNALQLNQQLQMIPNVNKIHPNKRRKYFHEEKTPTVQAPIIQTSFQSKSEFQDPYPRLTNLGCHMLGTTQEKLTKPKPVIQTPIARTSFTKVASEVFSEPSREKRVKRLDELKMIFELKKTSGKTVSQIVRNARYRKNLKQSGQIWDYALHFEPKYEEFFDNDKGHNVRIYWGQPLAELITSESWKNLKIDIKALTESETILQKKLWSAGNVALSNPPKISRVETKFLFKLFAELLVLREKERAAIRCILEFFQEYTKNQEIIEKAQQLSDRNAKYIPLLPSFDIPTIRATMRMLRYTEGHFQDITSELLPICSTNSNRSDEATAIRLWGRTRQFPTKKEYITNSIKELEKKAPELKAKKESFVKLAKKSHA